MHVGVISRWVGILQADSPGNTAEQHSLFLLGLLVCLPVCRQLSYSLSYNSDPGFVMKTFAIQDDDDRLLREARRWSFWFLILAIVNIGSSFAAGFFLSAGADRIDRRLRLVALYSLMKQVSWVCELHLAESNLKYVLGHWVL